jgi:hypothetical protein
MISPATPWANPLIIRKNRGFDIHFAQEECKTKLILVCEAEILNHPHLIEIAYVPVVSPPRNHTPGEETSMFRISIHSVIRYLADHTFTGIFFHSPADFGFLIDTISVRVPEKCY